MCHLKRLGLWLSFLTIVVVAMAATTIADVYIPASDDEVLETLPRSLLAGRDELTKLRRQLISDSKNPVLAAEVAGRYLQMGKAEGDPRFYGYARAAIKPWWEASDPPPTILKLRAKLNEKEHLYDLALADLVKLLKKDPRDVQAWIELANIYRVQGKYSQATQACDNLSTFAGAIPITLCRAPLHAVTGEAQQAYDALARVLPAARKDFPTTVQFILTMQAQIAQALGRFDEAEAHLREGLDANPGDSYLVRAYADFLLDQNRNQEAFDLVRDHVNDNGVLLRAAIAADRLGKDELSNQWQAQLARRFEEIRMRGSDPHGRFEARYLLELRDDPQRALAIALENWQKQKETRDTRNVLEAAVAAKNPDAAAPVLAFLVENGTEDVVLQKLADQLNRNE